MSKFSKWTHYLLSIFMRSPIVYKDWKGESFNIFDYPTASLLYSDLELLYWEPDYGDIIYQVFSEMREEHWIEKEEGTFVDTAWNDFKKKIIEDAGLHNEFISRLRLLLFEHFWVGQDEVSVEDISWLTKTVAMNRVWSDKYIIQATSLIYKYLLWVETVAKWDTKDEEEKYSLSVFEKEAWAPRMDAKYHDFLLKLNLDVLKEQLTDAFWNSFIPKWWQVDLLKWMSRYNFIAASRRSGKSYMAAYLIIRQLMLPEQQAVVIVPTLKNHAKNIFNYINRFLNKRSWKKSEWTLDHNDWKIRNNITDSECVFYSWAREDSIRWDFANLLVIDEAAFSITEEMFESALALTRTVKWMVYCISTVNPKSPKNWFYYNLVEATFDMHSPDSKSFAKRVTIYENDWIPQDEKEDIIRRWKRNMEFFNAEWMAVFGDWDLFNLSDFWVIDDNPINIIIGGVWEVSIHKDTFTGKWTKYQKYLLWYDPWQNLDRAWVCLLWMKPDWTWDILLAEYMDSFKYSEQVRLLLELKKLFWDSSICEIWHDYWLAWVAVEQIFQIYWYSPRRIQFIWGNMFSKNWQTNYVWKDLLIWKLQASLESGNIKWFSFQGKLRIEFESYDESRGKKKHHNDIISALMMANWWAYNTWLMAGPSEDVDDFAWHNMWDAMLNALGFPVESNGGSTDIYSRLRKFGY